MTTAELCPLDYGGSGDGCQPPNLITTLMNMALMPGSVDEPLYAGQAQIQVLLLLVAVGCVPWLLIVKPMLLKKRMDKQEEVPPLTLPSYALRPGAFVPSPFLALPSLSTTLSS